MSARGVDFHIVSNYIFIYILSIFQPIFFVIKFEC